MSHLFSRGKDWRIIIGPALLLLGAVGVWTGQIAIDGLRTKGNKASYDTKYDNLAIASFSLSMPFNWILSALVIGRLWWNNRQEQNEGKGDSALKPYMKVMIALVESGSLYSIILLGYVISYYVTDVRERFCT